MAVKSSSLAKNSLFNMAYNVLNLLFPLITSMYVSRILLPSGVGKVAYAQNITSYFITFAALGLPTYGVREIAKAKDDKNKVNRVFTQLLTINWISTAIAVGAFTFLINQDAFQSEKVLMICCGIQLLFNFVNIDWLYQGMEEYVYIVCRSTAIKAISILAIFVLVKNQRDYVIYAMISSIALAGNYIFNIINAKKYVRLDFSNFSLKKHWKPLMILGLTIFFSTIYSKLDITMLGAMNTEEETGLYSNAFRLIAIVTSICASVSAVFLPRLSYYYQNSKEKFNELINFGIKILSFFSFPMVTGLVVLAPSAIVLVYGNEFFGAVSTVRVLSLLVVIKAFGDLLCYQLAIATGHEKDRLFAYAAAAFLNMSLNFLLIPSIGRNGAAIASVLSELLLNAVQFFKMKKIVQYKLNVKPILQGVFASGIMAIGMVAITSIPMNDFIKCIAGFLVGTLIYLGISIAIKNEIVNVIGLKLKQFCSTKKV